MSKKNRHYTQEFKDDAVRLVLEEGYSVPEAARRLGIHDNLLRTWKKRHEQQQGATALTKDEQAELKQLRKENRQLRMERDILKKAAAYFAKESQ